MTHQENWDQRVIVGMGVATYDSAPAAHGSLAFKFAPGKSNVIGGLLAAMDAAQGHWIGHRLSCGYCHKHSTTLCPLGKHLLNDYYQAEGRIRALRELTYHRREPMTTKTTWHVPGCDRLDGHDGRDAGACMQGGRVLTGMAFGTTIEDSPAGALFADLERVLLSGQGGVDEEVTIIRSTSSHSMGSRRYLVKMPGAHGGTAWVYERQLKPLPDGSGRRPDYPLPEATGDL